MTSYQKRKEDIKRLNAENYEARREFMILKHVLLAIARGQKDHAKMTLKHFEKFNFNGCHICGSEIDEIKALIEKI